MNTHPSFDADEADIVKNLVPEGAEPGSPAGAVPAEEGATAPSPAPAPADPAATPALAAPAAPAEPAPAPAPAAAAPEPGTEGAAPSPAPAPGAAAPAAEPAAAPAAAAPAPAAPATAPADGNVKAALRASRQQEKRLRDRVATLERENEALKSGQTPESTDLTDEELEDLKQNFPAQYKVAMQARQLNERLRQQQQTEPREEFTPTIYPPEVQEVIDQVPDLLAWQHDPQGQAKFARAVEYDQALAVDPDWKTKPVQERFAEAARRTKAAMEPPASTPAPSPAAAPAAAPRTDPAQVIANAPTAGPKGLSDFRGGAPADAPQLDFSRMSDADIMASLPMTS